MFNDWRYPVIVSFAYIILTFGQRQHHLTCFGVINCVAIYLMFGVGTLLISVSLTFILWALLYILGREVLIERMKVPTPGKKIIMITCALIIIFSSDVNGDEYLLFERHSLNEIFILKFIGISYFGLRFWDCAISVIEKEKLINPLALFGYMLPFFMVIAGPIGSYRDHVNNNKMEVTLKFSSYLDCILIISTGFALKFFCAHYYKIIVSGYKTDWVFISYFDTWLYLLYIYFEFWGYSLIALGTGKLLGIHVPKNFNNPFLATSLTEFWSRWHMSLGAFVRRNLYNPIMLIAMRHYGTKNPKIVFICNVIALSVPFVFVGLWHKVTLSFLIWGLLLGIFVAMEHAIQETRIIKVLKYYNKKRYASILLSTMGIIYTQSLMAMSLSIVITEF